MSKTDEDKTKILSDNLFPVVGVGASAGGLEAFKNFVKAIPEGSGMAYILVQHLHPDHNSALPEILQRVTSIPVREISDNVEVKPNHVYVIPSNKMLVATDGILQLSPRPAKDQKNRLIDVFFSSLAEVHQSHAIGIILSGTGVDGTAGLKQIKGHGGVTIAQDAASAAYDAMPQSAIDEDVVDFILPPEMIPQQLLKLGRTLNLFPATGTVTAEQLSEEESYKQILALLRVRNGVDFTYYKQTTIRRRILRRLAILKTETIAEYTELLKQSKPEQDILFQDMLIPVTAFFRDPKTFEYLCSHVFPEIIKNKPSGKPLRIWIAGCSTGEEAYSMGMCLQEFLSDNVSAVKIQIFATDLSEKSIAKARAGLYHKKEVEGISDARLQQFFTKTDGNYQIKKMVRDMCVFACHNFLKDSPFSKIDLVSCRNVLIYLEPFLQKKAFISFHYALNDKGYLLLGKSETAVGSSDLFLAAGKKEKSYTRKTLTGKVMQVVSDRREETLKDKDYAVHSSERKKDDYQKNADEILLAKYTPVGVIVNEQLDIVQFRGSTGDYLEPSPGKASLNVLKMAREGLSFELRNALHKSKATNEVFSKEGIPIYGGKRLVSIEVIPLPNAIDPHFLILFKDTQKISVPVSIDQALVNSDIKESTTTRIRQLEKDLLQAREDMRGISEDQEAVNEELQSSNEELLSGSEELQSLNEELETSKEELQSTNEELITVNQELSDRNEQLNHARLYAETIVSIIHEPLLVLSKDFKILSANQSFYKAFTLSEDETVGKVLFALQDNQWDIPALRTQLLKTQTQAEKFLEWEVTYSFPTVGKRIICFNAQPIQKENGENWILLAFNDITLWKDREMREKKNADDVTRILETLPQITSTFTPDGSVTYFNQSFLDYSGMALAEVINDGWQQVVSPSMLDEVRKAWYHSMATGDDLRMEVQLKRGRDNTYRWHEFHAIALRNEAGAITSWVGAATDIQDQKFKEQKKDEFIGIASHELKTPLTTAKAYVELLQVSLKKSGHEELIFAQKAGESINRLHALINELLDVSKIKNGKLELNITPFDFNAMIADAIEGVQLTSPNHHIELTGKIKQPVFADRERLQQVIVNLLTNAIKYSPKTDKVLVNMEQEERLVIVSVRDSGIGIRKENLARIFERYYREEGRAIHFQGLGIGLSISDEIIDRHKGRIWATSEEGQGSTFYFTIPT